MNGDIEGRDEMASPPMTESRAFVDRAVRFLATRCGIMRFVSLGSGHPSANDIQDVAYSPNVRQEARVVYGDVDYHVVHNGETYLKGNRYAAMIPMDVRRLLAAIEYVDLLRVVDTARPLALITSRSLDVIEDQERPDDLMVEYRAWLPAGSYLVISHAVPGAAGSTLQRPIEQVRAFFGDFLLLTPGLVPVSCWGPEMRACLPRTVDWPDLQVLGGMAQKLNGVRA
jgi:hypothetical protein